MKSERGKARKKKTDCDCEESVNLTRVDGGEKDGHSSQIHLPFGVPGGGDGCLEQF